MPRDAKRRSTGQIFSILPSHSHDRFLYSFICFLSGFNPVWNEYFTFTVEVPELALVRILVYDSDRYVDDFIGYYVVPFNSLMQGMFQDINWSK